MTDRIVPALKSALTELSHPRLHRRDLPVRMLKVREQLERQWSTVDVRPPAALALGDIFAAVGGGWRRDHQISSIPARHRRWIPWVLFYPPKLAPAWLASDAQFVSAYCEWLRVRPRTSTLVGIIKVLLTTYPQGSPCLPQLLKGIQEALQAATSPRLTQWRVRDRTFGLLSPKGPEQFARLLQGHGTTVADLLGQAGFVEDLGQAAFLRHACDAYLAELRKALQRNSVALEDLRRLLEVVRLGPTDLRFEDRRGAIANALLEPFVSQQPSPDIQAALQTFFLERYGDPRVGTAPRWQPAGGGARDVMFRWLVSATIEDFFRLIDRTAYQHHWKYRQAFWRAYLREGDITKAWAVLGPEARLAARGSLRVEGAYGRLVDPLQPSHSVLLLQVGTLVVAEWSHMGTCRIWEVSNTRAPRFYQREYGRSRLVTDPDYSQVHHGSEHGAWQRKVGEYIRSQIGIRMRSTQYMPR